MNEIVVLTHNDLDAMGCVLTLEHSPELSCVKKEYFYTNYVDIPSVVDSVLQHVNNSRITEVVICDVSFSDNKDYLRKIYQTGANVTYVDHHLYPDGFFEEFPNMDVVHNTQCSATVLMHHKFNPTAPLPKLFKLIDVYDVWRDHHAAFSIAQDLNNYFWDAVKSDGCSVLDVSERFSNGTHTQLDIPFDFVNKCTQINTRCVNAISDLRSRGTIKCNGNISLCFVDEYFNEIMIAEMKRGVDFVIGISSYGIIRVRISGSAIYSDEAKYALREVLTGTRHTGHMNAFTYKTKNSKFEDLVKEAERVVRVVSWC